MTAIAAQAGSALPGSREEGKGGVLPVVPTLVGAAMLGLALSSQYLFQPFVWENWDLAEVLLGWLDVVIARGGVALCVAAGLLVATRIPVHGAPGTAALALAGIAAGAVAGEVALAVIDRWSTTSLAVIVLRSAHWTLLAALVLAMRHAWLRMARAGAEAREAALRAAALKRDLAQARLEALQRQIEPHFLFNTLATVRDLDPSAGGEGAQLLRSFVDYLRLSSQVLEGTQGTLAAELALCRAYLHIASVRMASRLAVRYEIDPAVADALFPALALATLVENADKHGISPRPEGGSVVVSAAIDGARLCVAVSDDGAGVQPSAAPGIGLANVRARLAALYGDRARLELRALRPRGVRASIELPLEPLPPGEHVHRADGMAPAKAAA